MPTALERIIDGASDPSVSTADLLRRAVAVAHRLRADQVKTWAEHELRGYVDVVEEELPIYRCAQVSIAKAQWTGFGGSSATTHLRVSDAPSQFAPLFEIAARQPVSELESLAVSEDGLAIPWPAAAVSWWNRLIDEEKAVHVSGMYLFSMRTEVPRQLLVSVLDAVRTQVMNLALDLESAGAQTGEVGGPTVDDPPVRAAVTTFVTNVYGPGAAITQAGWIDKLTVNVGDVDSLARAALALGLGQADVATYVEAVEAAQDDPERSKLSKFLEAVKSGGLSVAGGIASNVAADQLLKFAMSFLGT
ncbi:hypothetical protein [Actinotalea sp. K2]|uniref:AbiTii domain-containing protein n=1 Tax=Actinotalea sp. K2 TaxID=2939438 RepID=UPI002016A950|nr:hypothetical protein [Actinotalea sp. K2]MCL3863001.1 hypothetical protein [Actinotalea sp. K2]